MAYWITYMYMYLVSNPPLIFKYLYMHAYKFKYYMYAVLYFTKSLKLSSILTCRFCSQMLRPSMPLSSSVAFHTIMFRARLVRKHW